LLFSTTTFTAHAAVLNLTDAPTAEALGARAGEVSVVILGGKINHFGIPDYHAVTPGVHVWIAEFPQSRGLDVRSGEDGWWSLDVIKEKDADLHISLIYEKQGWVTTKSNVITVGDENITDLAIQFVDPDLYFQTMKPLIESVLGATGDKENATLRNAVVGTVGKSWASMHDDRLPHGDPGATVTAIPGAIGPVYFDEKVMPNPAYAATSVDGGVAWFNVPPGAHTVTAFKQDVQFADVTFLIDESDADNGVILYVGSPPHSIQGSNDSAPGRN